MKRIKTNQELSSKQISLEKIRGGATRTSKKSWTTPKQGGGYDTWHELDKWEDTDNDGVFDCNESGCIKTYFNITPSASTDICSL